MPLKLSGMKKQRSRRQRMLFVPQHPWAAINYQLIVDTRLEDLAGNHVGNLSISASSRKSLNIETKTASLSFQRALNHHFNVR